MKKIFIGIIFLAAIIGLVVYFSGKTKDFEAERVAQEKEGIKSASEEDWQWVDSQEKLYKLTSSEVDLVLKELKQRFPDKSERLKALSVLRLDTPYQLGCLGEETGRDKAPIFRIDVADCTVFVLTNVALFHSETVAEAREMMRFLNYRSEEMTFESRLHFSTDRNSVSPYFKDITEEVAGEKTEKKTIILNKKRADGTRLIDIDWQKETELKYVPNEHISREFFQHLPQAAGIAFIKEGDEEIGLDIRHEGFLFEGEIFFHASSVHDKVVVEDFFEYYFKDGPEFDGVLFFDLKI